MAQNICLGPFYIFVHEIITYPLRVCDLDPEEGMINDHAIVYQEETIVFAGNTTDIAGFHLFYGKLCVVHLLSHCCGAGIHIIFSAAGFLKNYLHHPNPTSPNHQI